MPEQLELIIPATEAKERSEQFSSDRLNSLYSLVNKNILNATELGLGDTRINIPAEVVENVIDKLKSKGYNAYKSSPTTIVVSWEHAEEESSEQSEENNEEED